MLKNLQKFYYPKTLEDAVKILGDHSHNVTLVAGGTTLTRIDNPQIETVVDISRCGLSYIKEDKDGLHIGAATTFQELFKLSLVQKFAHGLVSKASGLVSTRLVRNAGTVGGDIVYGYAYNDLPPVFLALDAKVFIADNKGDRWVDFAEFGKKHGTLVVGKSGILKEVLLPSQTKNWNSSYQRFARSFSDWEAQVIVATTLGFHDGTCENARIVVAAVTQHPTRFIEAENAVMGDSPDGKDFARAAEIVCEKIQPMADWRSSKEYRKEVLKVLIKRALAESSR